MNRRPAIDWRAQQQLLEPFLDYGGVVHVHGAEDAPFRLFADRLQDEWLPSRPERHWKVCVVDPDSHSTHNSAALAREIACVMGFQIPPETPPVNVTIASNNRVLGGDIAIQNITYVNNAPEARNIDRERFEVDTVLESLANAPLGTGLALLVLDAHRFSREARDDYYRGFWRDKFERLVGRRLLVVVFYQRARYSGSDSRFPPSAHRRIELHGYLGGDATERDAAISDISAWAIDAGFQSTPCDAHTFAEALVGTSETMQDLIDRISVYRASRDGDAHG